MGTLLVSCLDQMYFQYAENTAGTINKFLFFIFYTFKCCETDKGKGTQSFFLLCAKVAPDIYSKMASGTDVSVYWLFASGPRRDFWALLFICFGFVYFLKGLLI